MSKQPKRDDGLPRIVREQSMPAYQYQKADGGSGSLSSKVGREQEKQREDLRSINFAL